MDPASFELFRRRALGEAPAGFALARGIPTPVASVALGSASEAELWALHEELMPELRRTALEGGHAPTAARVSLLDVKAELGRRLLGPCRLCWLRCPVDRGRGETGACGLGAGLRPYQDFVHLGEELELIPTHAVFLAGCNYRCPYCSDWDHVARVGGDPEVAPQSLARSIDDRRREGVLSLTFVGGLPDVNLPGILEALCHVRSSVPVVWNSNMSATPEAHQLLEGVVDAYAADLKFGSEACSRVGAAAKGALEVTHSNLERVWAEAFLIVRHLVLPGHLECCTLPVLDWLGARLPGVRVNLMDQYQPTPRVRGTAWGRRPESEDLACARRHAEGLPLDLAGPGRIASPPAPGPERPLPIAEPVAGFSSRITIDANGDVVLENLSPELLGLVESLGDVSPELRARAQAAAAWREKPSNSPPRHP